MTICALLLARQFYDLRPSARLMYATLGLLFVNVSIGGTLTNFAAPPVLMVARPWGWSSMFMLSYFGWRALLAIVVSTLAYFVLFKRELTALAARSARPDIESPDEEAPAADKALLPIPIWITMVHLLFMAWTVVNAHYPVLFLGGFLFFSWLRSCDDRISESARPSPAAAGRLVSSRTGHPRGGCKAGGSRRCSVACLTPHCFSFQRFSPRSMTMR